MSFSKAHKIMLKGSREYLNDKEVKKWMN
jgi:hypothetical protein